METMENNKLKMYINVNKVLKKFAAVWSSIIAFAAEVTKLRANITTIEDLRTQQEEDIRGYVTERNARKQTLSDAALLVAGGILAYALDIGDDSLRKKVDFTPTDFIFSTDPLAKERGEYILATANLYTTELEAYGVGVAELTALETAVTDFNDILEEKMYVTENTQTATTHLKETIKDTDKLLKQGLDRLMARFKRTNKKFYSNYFNAREIYDLGSRKSGKGGIKKIEVWVITKQNILTQVEIGIKAPPNSVIIIFWGDGTKTVLTFDEYGNNQFVNHTYVTTGEYTISLDGQFHEIEEFHSNNSALIMGKIKGMKKLKLIVMQGNNFTEAFVNDTLIRADKSGVENGILNMLPCPLPTGKGLTAKANLEGKGWMILVG